MTDSTEWIKTASANEIVNELIDRLDAEPPEVEHAILTIFIERGKADLNGPVGIAYRVFTDEAIPKPRACVHYNFELTTGEWTGDIGRRVFRDEFDKAIKGVV